MPSDAEGRPILADEARLFARYLVGKIPPQDLIDRYADASRALLAEPVARSDVALVAFARRYAWSVPFLDAASGVLRPDGLLRNKILIMAAILETSPLFVDEFRHRTAHPVALVLRLATLGLAAAARFGVGLALYAIAKRSRA